MILSHFYISAHYPQFKKRLSAPTVVILDAFFRICGLVGLPQENTNLFTACRVKVPMTTPLRSAKFGSDKKYVLLLQKMIFWIRFVVMVMMVDTGAGVEKLNSGVIEHTFKQ